VLFAEVVDHTECMALRRIDIDRLSRKESRLGEQCRLCFYKTMFEGTPTDLKREDRVLFYKLLLKVDPDSATADTGYDPLEF
jgi:hypothetical protein